jgi:hypothetical protein
MRVISALAISGLATATTVNVPGGTPVHATTGDTYFGANGQVSTVSKDWTSWSAWSACSKTCGGGVISRIRTCKDTTVKHHTAPQCWVGPKGRTVVHFTKRLHPSFKCKHVSATKCACVVKDDGCRQFDSKADANGGTAKTFHITSDGSCDDWAPTDNCDGKASEQRACNAQPCIDYAELAAKAEEKQAKDDAEKSSKAEASAKAFERKAKADAEEKQQKIDTERSVKAEAQSKAFERKQKDDAEKAAKQEKAAKDAEEKSAKESKAKAEEKASKDAEEKASKERTNKAEEKSAKDEAEKSQKDTAEKVSKENAAKAEKAAKAETDTKEKATKEVAAKVRPAAKCTRSA